MIQILTGWQLLGESRPKRHWLKDMQKWTQDPSIPQWPLQHSMSLRTSYNQLSYVPIANAHITPSNFVSNKEGKWLDAPWSRQKLLSMLLLENHHVPLGVHRVLT